MQATRFLEAAVAAGLNVLVSGGTQARQDHVPQHLLRGDPGMGAGHHLRGDLRLREDK
ncbi:hypothetical protein [Geodermatophilus sp. SYSU D00814]